MTTHIKQTVYKGDSNLGIFFNVTEKIALIPKDTDSKTIDVIKEILNVEIKRVEIWDSNLIGLFSAANSNGIILPKTIFPNEVKHFSSLGLNVYVLDDDHTALGNLILANDRAAIVSPLIPKKFVKEIEDTLGVETIQRKIANLSYVGSLGIVTNKGLLLYRDIEEDEFNELKEFFKVKYADIGTANLGSPYVGSCVIANSNGVLVGEKTTPIEMERILEALGFI